MSNDPFTNYAKQRHQEKEDFAQTEAASKAAEAAFKAEQDAKLDMNRSRVGAWLSWLAGKSIDYIPKFQEHKLHLRQSGLLDQKNRRTELLISAGPHYAPPSEVDARLDGNHHLTAYSPNGDSTSIAVHIDGQLFNRYDSLDDSMTNENAQAMLLALFKAAIE